jgi:hypothetical protein
LYSSEFRQPKELPILPDDYVAFLNQFNGVEFETDLAIEFCSGMNRVPEEPFEDCFMLSVLYGHCSDQEDNFLDLVRCQQDYGFWEWNSGKLVSIGGNHSFNELCLSIRESDFGCIYRWLWPSEPPLESDLIGEGWRNGTLDILASSFSEFLEKLEHFAVPS